MDSVKETIFKLKKKPSFIFFIIFVVGSSLFLLFTISEFKSLPSPIYGGDYYYQAGAINHIKNGGNPFESSSISNSVPGYLPLYGGSAALFIGLLSFSTLKGMLYFSVFLYIFSLIIWFILFFLFFSGVEIRTEIAVLGSILVNFLGHHIILKYTPFTFFIMIPIFLISFYHFFNKKSISSSLTLGITCGLLSLSHSVAFIGSVIILFSYFVYESIMQKRSFKNNWKFWFIVAVIAFLISLLIWYKPIFLWHLHQKYDRAHMDFLDFSRLGIQFKFIWLTIKRYLLNFTSVDKGFLTLLTWGGLFAFFASTSRKKDFLKIFGIGTLIAVFSYFLTEPLIKTNFFPSYLSYFYLGPLLFFIGLYGLAVFLAKLKHKKTILFILICMLATASIDSLSVRTEDDRWFKTGYAEAPMQYLNLERYLEKNSNINDVILSSKELSFAVNALSGRKLLVNRWAQQNNPYEDFSERDLASALILYGNNTNKKLDLVDKYDIKYLYWDYYWIQSEYYFDEEGKMTGWFDPLLSIYTTTREGILKENNVSYFIERTWIDPSSKNNDVRKFKLIFISSENYYNITHPWKPDLNSYLKEVWSYKQNGQKIAILYKIEI